MRIPNKIKTLTEMRKWVDTKKPKLIEIGKKAGIRQIAEFNDYGVNKWKWKNFNGIPLRYL